MLFSSPAFLVFFTFYFLLHLVLPMRWRLPLILVGSTIFYGYWNPAYVAIPYLLMALAIVGTWAMMKAPVGPWRRLALSLTVAGLLAPLVLFKYLNFLYNDVLGLALPTHGSLLDAPLPLGISFVTFTLIGYTVDVYRGVVVMEKRLSLLSGAVLFFPHLIAGPVVLPRQLIGQLAHPRSAALRRCRGAVLLFAWGLVKKLVFADQLAAVVNPIFAHATGWHNLDYVLAMFGFSLQIYCDFSGYTDMAIAVARMLGVKLPNNFERPYAATSVVDFWQRWHITLSNWLRVYLYIPLGGNRHGRLMQIRNVLITMALGGLWHGSRWTFVLWGLTHGLAIALTHLACASRWRSTLLAMPRWLCVLLTFNFITFTWLLFRAASLGDAWIILNGAFTAPWPDVAGFAAQHAFALGLLGVFLLTHHLDSHAWIRWWARKMPAELAWPLAFGQCALALVISAGNSADFIYFDF